MLKEYKPSRALFNPQPRFLWKSPESVLNMAKQHLALIMQHTTGTNSQMILDLPQMFANDPTDRTQPVQIQGSASEVLRVIKGVPQGSVLCPFIYLFLLFATHKNNLGQNIQTYPFISLQMTLYSFTALHLLRTAFDRVQEELRQKETANKLSWYRLPN